MGRRPGVARRSYGQRDAVAAALDSVGDRWTLLIVRELLLGPRRWTDLLANLEGIGKNLLAQRLRELEDSGFVNLVTLPWSSSRTRLYGLTAKAIDLERVVYGLARLGLTQPMPEGEMRPESAAIAFASACDPAADDVVHTEISGCWFTLRLESGMVRASRGQSGEPSAVVTGTAEKIFRDAQRTARST